MHLAGSNLAAQCAALIHAYNVLLDKAIAELLTYEPVLDTNA